MVKLTVEKEMSSKQAEKIVAGEGSKSAKMKALFLGGVDVKTIADMMGTRYNFVYNVVSEMIRQQDLEGQVESTSRTGKKDEVLRLLNEGKDLTAISKELKMNYNQVWKIKKEFKGNAQ